ncbi:MAG: glycosyltransferase family 2 protein [Anaerolineae bacterium]
MSSDSWRDHARPTLSVVIVSWNVRDLLRQALQSIYNAWGDHTGLEVIVVDNASHDHTPTMIRKEFPEVRLIASTENRGYGGGANLGIAQAQGEFILILNPDVEVTDTALHRLVQYARQHPKAGLVAPQLLTPEGTVQSSRRRFPTLPILFLESTWLQDFLPCRIARYYYAKDVSENVVQDVDWVQGAALLVRREVAEETGGFDEDFFMYSEELDWCRRIKKAGWRIVYLPKARIVHHEGKSSEQVVPARHIYFQSSKVHYTRKYHGVFIAEILRYWLLGQYIWQLSVEGVKWLLGHRRPLRVTRIAAYRQVLRSGLRHRGLTRDSQERT